MLARAVRFLEKPQATYMGAFACETPQGGVRRHEATAVGPDEDDRALDLAQDGLQVGGIPSGEAVLGQESARNVCRVRAGRPMTRSTVSVTSA